MQQQHILSRETTILFIPSILLVALLSPQYMWGPTPSAQIHLFYAALFSISLVAVWFFERTGLFELLDRKATSLLISFVAVYAMTSCIVNWVWYDNFLFKGQDVTLYSQALWTTSHGRAIFFDSVEGMSHFGIHFVPFYFFLVPLYYLYPDPRVLLLVKGVFVSLSAVPLYAIVRLENSRSVALFLSLSFLLYTPVLNQMIFEFYGLQFLPVVMFSSYYFWKKKKFIFHMLFLIMCLAIREELVTIAVMFGIYSLIRRRRLLWIVGPILLGVSWAVAAFRIVIPFFSTVHVYHPSFANIVVEDLLKINAGSLLTRENATFLYWMFCPLLGIAPFLSWEWILGLPILFGSLYTSHLPAKQIDYHYQMVIASALFISLIGGVRLVSDRLSAAGVARERGMRILALSTFMLVIAFTGGYFIDRRMEAARPTSASRAILKEVLLRIPKDASVLAPRYAATHLTNRMMLYIDQACIEQAGDPPVEYVLVDTNTNDRNAKDLNSYFQSRLNSPPIYSKIYDRRGVMLYRRSMERGRS